jgi:hypothetical protein
VLAVQLKRFSLENFESNELSKIKHFVEYPKTLDLEPFLSEVEKKVENESEEEYYLRIVERKKEAELELCGVVVHLGSTLSNGHYVAYVRCKSEKKVRIKNYFFSIAPCVSVCLCGCVCSFLLINCCYFVVTFHFIFYQRIYDSTIMVRNFFISLFSIRKTVPFISKNFHHIVTSSNMNVLQGVTDTWYRTDDTVVTVCSEVEALSQKDAYLLLFENKKTKIKTKTQALGHLNSNRFPPLRFPISAFSCPITGKRNRYDLENTENERMERTVNKNGNKRRVGVGAVTENRNEVKMIDQFKTLDDVPIYGVYDHNTHEYDNPHNVYQSANSLLERKRESDLSDMNERAKFKILYHATNTINENNHNIYDNNNYHKNNNYKDFNNNNDNRITNNNQYKDKEKDKRIIKVREEPYSASTNTNTEKEKEKRKRQLDENSENRKENDEQNKRQKSNNNTALRASVLTQSFIFSKLITLGKLTKLGAENVIKSVKKIIFEPDDTDV